MTQRKLLTNEYPLILLPKLAKGLRKALKAYASDGAAFLQQVHYWCTTTSGVVDEYGRRWIYNTYSDWLDQFPWLTEHGFRKIKSALLDLGILETTALNGCDRTLYYSVNYNHELIALFFEPTATDGCDHLSTIPSVDCSTNDNTYITPENISSNNNNSTVVASSESINQEVVQHRPVRPKQRTVNKSFTKTTPANHSPIFSDERIKQVEQAGIPLNPTLCKAVMEYTLDEVRSAIAHYQQVVKEQGQRNNPGGWLTNCLRGKWWEQSTVKAEDDKYPLGFLDAYERLKAAGIVLVCDPNGLPLDGNRQPKVRVINELLPGGQELVMWRDAIRLL